MYKDDCDSVTVNFKDFTVNESGVYSLDIIYDYFDKKNNIITYNTSYSFNCPGLVFSCKLLGVNVDDCYNKNGVFTAEFSVKGLKQSESSQARILNINKDLDYSLKANKQYIDINNFNSRKGSLPKSYSISPAGEGKYKLTYDSKDAGFEVNEFYINFDGLEECRNEDDFPDLVLSDGRDCRLVREDVQEVVTNKEIRQETGPTNGEQKIGIEESSKQQDKTPLEIKVNYTKPALIIGGAIIIAALVIAFIIHKKK